VDPALVVAILNSRGVRRQLVGLCRGAASLDIREHTLAKVKVPRSLLSKKRRVRTLWAEVAELRTRLRESTTKLSELIEEEFGETREVRPPTAGGLRA
jgi:hypothetical protein